MEIRFQTGGAARWKADVMVSFAFEGEGAEQVGAVLLETAPWLSIAPAWRDFRGKREEQVMFYGPAAMNVSRVLETGLGRADELCLTEFRYAVGRALRQCREYDLETVGLDGTALARVAEKLSLPLAALVREAVVASLTQYVLPSAWPKLRLPVSFLPAIWPTIPPTL